MHLVKIIIEYTGSMTIGGEYKTEINAGQPFIMDWFAGVDLPIETEFEKITVNTFEPVYIVRPQVLKNLTVIASEEHTIFNNKLKLEIAKGSDFYFLTVNDDNDKFAFRLPNRLFE